VSGKPVEVFTLTNTAGVEIKAMTYGGIITSWRVPDRRGQMADIVLGYDDPAAYVKNNSPYVGAIVGRYGNRIGKAQFALDGRTYTLARTTARITFTAASGLTNVCRASARRGRRRAWPSRTSGWRGWVTQPPRGLTRRPTGTVRRRAPGDDGQPTPAT
jgi:hypothetical protein